MPDLSQPVGFRTAACSGGVLDGRSVDVPATAARFLAADRVANRAWIYQLGPDGGFRVVTDHDNSLIYPDGPVTGERSLDWARLGGDSRLPVVNVVQAEENEAGEPVDDGWQDTPVPPPLPD